LTSANDQKGPQTGPFFAPAWNMGRLILTPASRPLIMGILNLTPDSFYDGGRLLTIDDALNQAANMIEAGADVLDLGAESSRPGAETITTEEECQRLLPALKAIRSRFDIPITADTVRPETARAALDNGADAINDINGGRDPEMLQLAASAGCGLILMHMQGTPTTMQANPNYQNVVTEVAKWLDDRCRDAMTAGVNNENLMVDPGIGFGKTLKHNLELLGNLNAVSSGRPLLLGASRKSFISHLTDAPVDDRLAGSLAALSSAFNGGACMVRVHDVAASVQYLGVLSAFS